MPDGVEPSGGGADWRKEGISQPNDEDCILLSQRLSSLHSQSVAAAYPLACPELHDASHQRGYCYAENVYPGHVTMIQGAYRHADSEGQSHRPHIECKVVYADYASVYLWQQELYAPCEEQRGKENGEHLFYY